MVRFCDSSISFQEQCIRDLWILKVAPDNSGTKKPTRILGCSMNPGIMGKSEKI